MKWLLLSLPLAIATHLWLCIRVGRSSSLFAVLTFFLGPIGALYSLFKHRGDDEHSVTVPFVVNLVFTAAFFVIAWQFLLPLFEADARELRANAGPPAAPVVAVVPVAASAPASAVVPAPVSSGDPIDVFSHALRDAGLVHTVTRLPPGTQLPDGVAEAALFSVTPLGGGASAPAGGEVAITLFRCASVTACRQLAGLQLQQADRRRVLQQGLLLLSTPPVAVNESDLTPAAIMSAFRKLPS